MKLYAESSDNDSQDSGADSSLLPPIAKGDMMEPVRVTATERYTQHPPRYTEASLVKKMEDLGIGRPSTYAPTISTIQQREYVEKGDRPRHRAQFHHIYP